MYRYSANGHTKTLLSMGCIRIGTLYDFRRIEHRRGIADPTEGTKLITHQVDFFHNGHTLSGNPSEEALIRHYLAALEVDPGNCYVTNSTLNTALNSTDLYILCFSRNLSQETMAQFDGAQVKTGTPISQPVSTGKGKYLTP